MKEKDMTCVNCFYSQESNEDSPVYGRDADGDAAESEDILIENCICYEGPKPLVISEQIVGGLIPDIQAEPSYHRCGRGRWWENGKWISWLGREDE